jgi:transketolase
VFTHDSIGLGEDGPTHQPIEHLAALRAIPNLVTLRPADANEVAQAWLTALKREDGPTALALTRQSVPTLDRTRFASATELVRGAYVLADLGQGEPQLILMGSGSEVGLIVEAGEILASNGTPTRLVSFPSWELFKSQPQSYQDSVLPQAIPARVAVEAGVSLGWERWIGSRGEVVGIDRFGESAPYEEVYRELGLTAAHVVDVARSLLEK